MQLLHYYSDKPIDESLRLLDEQIPNVGLREYVKGELRAKIKRRKSS